MQILTNNQNTNFTGAFRFKPNEIKAKADVPQLFTQGKQVFHDILEKGDEVIVLRNNYDKRVGNYIKENNIEGIEYYPEINTKSGLDDEHPEGLLALIKDKAVIVKKNMQEIFETIATQKSPKKMKAHNVNKELIKISDALRLNIENPKIVSNKSFTRVRDDNKKRTIELIAPNKATTYVHVVPDSLNESSTKCIINGKGELVKKFETPTDIIRFNKLFKKMKTENVNQLIVK